MPFFYQQEKLKVGSQEQMLDLWELANQYPDPIYLYDLDAITSRYQQLEQALSGQRHSIHYAMKANSNLAILKHFLRLGSNVDTVSEGEIKKAIQSGFQPQQIIFSGVGKTKKEIQYAIDLGIKQINVESLQELERIANMASDSGQKIDIGIRVNPDVNPNTHPYITTGFRENKFGLGIDHLDKVLNLISKTSSPVRLRGLSMHIGSQLFDLDCLRDAILIIKNLFHSLVGQGFQIDRLDIGGGLGIRYETDSEIEETNLICAFGKMVHETLSDIDAEILIEPGRILVARSGLLIGQVQYIKSTDVKNFAILNTGMHHLIRPALYGAHHRVLPLIKNNDPAKIYDVVGPICESSDFLAKNIELPLVRQDDYLAIADVGAYGASMASSYNSHSWPRELAIERASDGQFKIEESQ